MSAALTLAATAIALGVGFPLAIFTLEMLAGIVPGRRESADIHSGNCVILIPAHNESAGIVTTLESLAGVTPAGTRILVVADNCNDDTAVLARTAGAEVVERHDPSRRGKGYALACGRDTIAAMPSPPRVVIVLDADCRLFPGSIEDLVAHANQSEAPAQAVNLISPDLGAPPLVQISSFAMLVKNLFRSRGMQRLGGAALLTGTGMALPWALFSKADLATGALAEDLSLGVEMTRAGHVPRLIETAQVRSAPASMKDALQQRRRWEHGFLETVGKEALPLLRSGIGRGSAAEVILALHLIVPPLALLLVAVTAALAICTGLAVLGGSFSPALSLAFLLAIALMLVLAAWIQAGRAYLGAGALMRAPLYVLWKLPLYVGFLRSRETEWKRTPRGE